jgi:hypothetical protein
MTIAREDTPRERLKTFLDIDLQSTRPVLHHRERTQLRLGLLLTFSECRYDMVTADTSASGRLAFFILFIHYKHSKTLL